MDKDKETQILNPLWGVSAWIAFYALVLAYCGAVVLGDVDAAGRLGWAEVMLVGLTAVVALLLVSPGLLSKVERLKSGQFEVQLWQVRKDLREILLDALREHADARGPTR